MDAVRMLPLCLALQSSKMERFVPLSVLVGPARSRALVVTGTTVDSSLRLFLQV